MCTNYRPSASEVFAQDFEPLDIHDLPATWPDDVYRNHKASIIVPGEDCRRRAVNELSDRRLRRQLKSTILGDLNAASLLCH